MLSFRLNDNDLGGTVSSLGELPNLQFVDLSSNELTGYLMNASNLTMLKSFRVDGNMLSGTVPTSFADILSLGTLRFCYLFELLC